MNSIITIPHGVMRVLNCNWDIDWRTQSTGEGLDGVEQIFPSPFPRWIGSPRLSLHGESLRLWRATRARARGRANLYRVPLIDRDDVRDPYGGTDTFGRPLNGDYGDGPTGVTVGDQPAGSTTLTMAGGAEHMPQVGTFVSVADWPCIITKLGVGGGRSLILQVEPPLRRAVPEGSTVNLRAHGLFRATDDDMGRVDVGANGHAQVDLSFQEWIGPGR